MLDKMIGVSPPQKGEALETKLAESKRFRDTSGGDYRKDFEKALQDKLDRRLEQRKDDLAAKREEERRNAAQRQEGSRAEKDSEGQNKKSLGGTKKRVTEDEDKIVSNVMASIENNIETPESKIDGLAKIEVGITENAQLADLLAKASLPAAEGSDVMAQTVSADAELSLAQLSDQMPTLEGEVASLSPEQALEEAALQQQDKALSSKLASSSSLQADLEAAVDFTEGSKSLVSEGLNAQAKPLNEVQAQGAQKAQQFEQDILSKLQQDKTFSVPQAQSKGFSEQSQFEQKSFEQMKDLRSDLMGNNGLHQAAGQSHGEFKTHLQATASTSTAMANADVNADVGDASIREIMNQAQFLVRRGGGEVNVKMTPEGMGEVQLRVLLQNGKLNVEMQTQTHEAKKLLEESLSDLKSGLAAQRLSLEHVKIDTVGATNADNTAQNQSNLNQGNSQHQAREFWNDMQQNSQQGFSGNSSGSSSGQREWSGSSVDLQAGNRAQSAQALRTYGGTKGATLNRVA
ncbi:flagellar hook-length control protein FliK [Pseudobdellovibrio exovorus]|uniref:Flagellar hook-length control protein n=1 Tax=Pseudobdellovibrio exovorus JSS TaxID=1184267 RepID=M4VE89_9BACT|nr:flagellar hook-length control protein FliK [Pseudobdellovibrio exovorus]AGH96356.1 flagellar hook-length control protein [Pseudobdellovibrio exovorus JSS]